VNIPVELSMKTLFAPVVLSETLFSLITLVGGRMFCSTADS